MITTISFDADATLWDFSKVMCQALTLALIALKARVPEARSLTIDDLQTTRDEVASALQDQNVSHETIRLRAFEQTLRDLGHDDPTLAAHLTTIYLDHRFSSIELFPDVRPTLARLRGHYNLGLVSNGNSYPERCGLPDTFSFVLFAHSYGVHKPDPYLYTLMLEQAQVVPGEILHIGDSLVNDIAPAQAIGVRAVWLNRRRQRNSTAIRPWAEIASLDELVRIVDGLQW
jgi:HAD superfamily hydrolase (TIGR01509 family)